jgi:hypothetical protein
MKHVHVAMEGSKFEPENIRVTKNSLVSLVKAFEGSYFGLASFHRLKNLLNEYRESVVIPQKGTQWIDSGGYSIIVGDIGPQDIYKCTKFYAKYLRAEAQNFDKIFSLDIPISLKYHALNTKKKIYDLNYQSLYETINVMEDIPELKDKMYYIYHFKIKEQHEIWNKLYKDLDIGKHFTHRAIGGLVGMKGGNHCPWINFTSFLPMLFKLFFDYIQAGDIVPVFKIHVLGVYGRGERFCIAFVERLLNEMAKEYKTKVEITYDSINYIRTSQLKFRDLDIYDLDDNGLHEYTVGNTPDDLLKSIYPDEEITVSKRAPRNDARRRVTIDEQMNKYQFIKDEIARCYFPKSKPRLKDISCFAPLNIHSNLQIDNTFEQVVDQNSLDVISPKADGTPDFVKIDDYTDKLKDSKDYHNIFTSHLCSFINRDLVAVSELMEWWINDRKESSLEAIIDDQISKIKYSVKTGPGQYLRITLK